MGKLCFVISPIGDPGSEVRRRADGVLDEIIRPAFEPLQYAVERADHDKSPGIVTESIIGKIIDADLVVADLTGHNPNVMYELAVRHAVSKPVIQMHEQGERLPFDVQGQNTIPFQSDLAGRATAIRNLMAAHEAIVSDANLGNPIRRTIELKAATAGAAGTNKLMLEMLSELTRSVAEIRVSTPVTTASTTDTQSHKGALDVIAMWVLGDANLRQVGVRSLAIAYLDGGVVEASGIFRGNQLEALAPLPSVDLVTGPLAWKLGRQLVGELLEQVAAIQNARAKSAKPPLT